MGRVSVFLHTSIEDHCRSISDLLETSLASIVEDIIKYVKDNELEEEIWGDAYTDALEAEQEEEED